MKPAQEEDPNFKKILAFLLKDKGFDGRHYKPNYIKRRVAVRMRATGTPTYQDYLHVLQNNRQEPSQLLDRLTIHVTEFFRDPEVYQAVKNQVWPGAVDSSEKKVRVWCAGCSTGEEPYSVAISLEEWSFAHPGTSFEVFATDIDPPSVRTAEKGEYPIEALKKLGRNQVTRWFHVEGATARVVADLKKHIKFRAHNLLNEWPVDLSGFDVIFCRNLLIYLTSAQQQKIYEQFAGALTPRGFLVLGLTETLLGPSRRYFQCVDIRHRLYRRTDSTVNSLPETGEKQRADG